MTAGIIAPRRRAWLAWLLPRAAGKLFTRPDAAMARRPTRPAPTTIPPMNIILNGEPRTLASAMTVAALVEDLGYAGKRVAVERNGEIVPRSRHADTAL